MKNDAIPRECADDAGATFLKLLGKGPKTVQPSPGEGLKAARDADADGGGG